MKKFLVSICMLLAVCFAHAQQLDLSELPADVQAKITTMAADAAAKADKQATAAVKAASGISSASARNEASEWANMIGGAMFEGARKTNMLVHEFSQTTVGRVTIFIVAYKIIGTDMMRLICGAIFMTAAFMLGYGFFRQSKPKFRVKEWQLVPVLWGAFSVRRALKYDEYPTPREFDTERAMLAAVIICVGGIFAALIAFIR